MKHTRLAGGLALLAVVGLVAASLALPELRTFRADASPVSVQVPETVERQAPQPAPVAGAGDAAQDTVSRSPELEVVPFPELTSIRIVADTVWFLAPLQGHGPPPRSVAYVRSAGTWLLEGARPDLERGPLPADSRLRMDTFPVAPGLRLAHLPNHLTHFHVLMHEDGSTRLLPNEIVGDEKRRLVERIYGSRDVSDEEVARFPVESAISATVVEDSVLWLGRAGGWSEGTGGLGGLVRYDLRTGALDALDALWHEDLARATVTGLAFAAGRLWIGTLYPGETGPWGESGIVIHHPATGEWDRLTTASSALPSDVVLRLAQAGDTLWVSTTAGPAVIDARTGAMEVRYFQPELAGDSVVVALSTESRMDPLLEVAYAYIARLGVERTDEFIAAVRQADPDPFLELYRSAFGWERPLADSAFIPFLVPALARGGTAASLAGAALEAIGGVRLDAGRLTARLDSLPPLEALPLARTLAEAGDPASLGWLRRTAAHPELRYRGIFFQTLAGLGDTASIPLFVSSLGDPRDGPSAMLALRMLRSPDAWRAAADAMLDLPDVGEVGWQFLDAVQDEKHAAPRGDPAFDSAVTAIARRTLDSGYGAARAAVFLLRQGDTSVVPVLIDALGDRHQYYYVLENLIAVTGVDTVPAFQGASDHPKAREFWTRWWQENIAGFQPVPPQE